MTLSAQAPGPPPPGPAVPAHGCRGAPGPANPVRPRLGPSTAAAFGGPSRGPPDPGAVHAASDSESTVTVTM